MIVHYGQCGVVMMVLMGIRLVTVENLRNIADVAVVMIMKHCHVDDITMMMVVNDLWWARPKAAQANLFNSLSADKS